MKVSMITLAAVLLASPVHAADSIEAVGAEKCGGKVNTYEVEFLAPESTQVEATAKAGKGGATDPHRDTASLYAGRPALPQREMQLPRPQGADLSARRAKRC